MTERRFTSQEVCHLALVTLRQLQWWDEQGILSPEQRSRKRSYTAHEVICVCLYRELEERGFSMRAFRHVSQQIRAKAVTLPSPSRRYLLTDGQRVEFLEHDDVVLSFLSQRRNPRFALIPLAPLAARIEAAPVEALPVKTEPGEMRERKFA